MPTFRKGNKVFKIQGSVEGRVNHTSEISIDDQAAINLANTSKEIRERAEYETLMNFPTEPETTEAFYLTCTELQGHVIARWAKDIDGFFEKVNALIEKHFRDANYTDLV